MRCPWAEGNEMSTYHDEEWGVPQHDTSGLFELMTLEGAQAGLSWLTILRRREGYRRAFAFFNPIEVAVYTNDDVDRLVLDPSIIRHRGKIESTITNARAILTLPHSVDGLDQFLWSFVDGVPLEHDWDASSAIPVFTDVAVRMSKDLKKRGFRFVGPTTCYAFMQAAGLVNDHLPSCYRFEEVRSLKEN
jgi:DNA-3-methyladenine glycosylase I